MEKETQLHSHIKKTHKQRLRLIITVYPAEMSVLLERRASVRINRQIFIHRNRSTTCSESSHCCLIKGSVHPVYKEVHSLFCLWYNRLYCLELQFTAPTPEIVDDEWNFICEAEKFKTTDYFETIPKHTRSNLK